MGNHLPETYDVGRLQDENLREIFLDFLNAKLESLKFDNVEYEWNKFWKIVYKIVDDVLAKKVKNAAKNNCEKYCVFNREEEGLIQELFVWSIIWKQEECKESRESLFANEEDVKQRLSIKVQKIWMIHPEGIIVQYCTGMFLNTWSMA